MAEFTLNDQTEATVGANLNSAGKYSANTIDIGTEGFGGTVTPAVGVLGTRQGLTDLFPDTPIGNGEVGDIKANYTDAASLKTWFFANVVRGTVNDTTFGIKAPDGTNFSLEYTGAPNLEEVPLMTAVGDGLPATPYTPNIASAPGADRTKQPVMDGGDVIDLKANDDGNTFVGQKITAKSDLASVAAKVVTAAIPAADAGDDG